MIVAVGLMITGHNVGGIMLLCCSILCAVILRMHDVVDAELSWQDAGDPEHQPAIDLSGRQSMLRELLCNDTGYWSRENLRRTGLIIDQLYVDDGRIDKALFELRDSVLNSERASVADRGSIIGSRPVQSDHRTEAHSKNRCVR